MLLPEFEFSLWLSRVDVDYIIFVKNLFIFTSLRREGESGRKEGRARDGERCCLLFTSQTVVVAA